MTGGNVDIETLLERHEGCVLHAYKDHLGWWTIGIGRLIDQRKGGGITKDEARMLLEHDIARVERDLFERQPWMRSLSWIRRAAMLDMAFNLGVSGLLDFQRMLGHMQNGDYEQAAAEALDSRWATQVGVRSEDIAEMIEHGRWPERLL